MHEIPQFGHEFEFHFETPLVIRLPSEVRPGGCGQCLCVDPRLHVADVTSNEGIGTEEDCSGRFGLSLLRIRLLASSRAHNLLRLAHGDDESN